MEPTILIALITGILGLSGVIIKSLYDRNIEHRLTVLEENRLSKEDLKCIKEAIVLIRLWFKVYEEELPRQMKNPPGIDNILDIITGDLSAVNKKLSAVDQGKLINYLEERIKTEEDSEKRFQAKILLGMIRLRIDESWKDKPISEIASGVC